ncbi:hypothetical protein [Magnetospirillum sp. 64-120]|nr:hypothetical protein [Magnetospirillum sp. 64-120]
MTAAASSFRSEVTALVLGLGILCAGTVALVGSIGLGAWIMGI